MASNEDIGIDFGASNILISKERAGIVFSEPSLLAVNSESREVLEFGEKAYQMIGREPGGISVLRTIEGRSIKDFDLLILMLRHCIKSVSNRDLSPLSLRRLMKPRAAIAVSAQLNDIERSHLLVGMSDAGVSRIHILERTIAAAIGGGININNNSGRMVVDIGAATADIAVVAGGDIVAYTNLEKGGDMFTEALIRYVRLKYNLMIGPRTAEDAKCVIGCVDEESLSNLSQPVAGRNLIEGKPGHIMLSSAEVCEAMEEPIHQFIEGLQSVFEALPDELANDVCVNGILLTGGGAQMKGLSRVIERELKIACRVPTNPRDCVAMGCTRVLTYPNDYVRLLKRRGR